MSYVSLALLGLQIVKWLMDRYSDSKQFDAGQEHQILEQSKAIMATTAEGKRLLEKLNAMSDGELDDITDAVGRANKGG